MSFWIKRDKSLTSKPEVLQIASRLNIDRWSAARRRNTAAARAVNKNRCHKCGRDLNEISGGTGNVTSRGKPWCGCAVKPDDIGQSSSIAGGE